MPFSDLPCLIFLCHLLALTLRPAQLPWLHICKLPAPSSGAGVEEGNLVQESEEEVCNYSVFFQRNIYYSFRLNIYGIRQLLEWKQVEFI